MVRSLTPPHPKPSSTTLTSHISLYDLVFKSKPLIETIFSGKKSFCFIWSFIDKIWSKYYYTGQNIKTFWISISFSLKQVTRNFIIWGSRIWIFRICKILGKFLNYINLEPCSQSSYLKTLRQPSQNFWPKILTPYFFYSNLSLTFLRSCCENIFKIVCIVSEKIEK